MPLPTTNLTLHFNGSDSDKLFTVFDSGGSHSSPVTDGNKVKVWDDEGDGISDIALMWTAAGSGSEPTWREGTPLMDLPCLDFDGSDDYMAMWTQNGADSRNMDAIISASSFNMLVAFYAESVTAANANAYDNHGLLADSAGYVGLYLKDVSGTPTLFAYVFDGAVKTVSVACTTGASHVAQMRLSGGTLYLSIDGGSELSTACGNVSSLAGGILRVGHGYDGHAQYYNGRVGELAVYNSDPGGTGDHLTYFTDKWLGAGDVMRSPIGAFCGGRVVSRGGLI